MATAAGTHSVWVQHKGQNIAGSPFSAEVAHSAIAADCSYVVQEGLERGVSGSQVWTLLSMENHTRKPLAFCADRTMKSSNKVGIDMFC